MTGRTDVLPETIERFERLRGDTIHIHARWKYFRQLYADEKGDRIALLKDTASNFFGDLQWLYLHDVCVGVSRLTDPVRSAGRDNLVLESLVEALSAQFPADPIGSALRTSLQAARQAADPLRNRRNKTIAHRDLPTALDPTANPMPGLSRQMIETALAAIVSFLNEFEVWYADSRTVYRFPVTVSDARFLLHALERARRYAALEEAGRVEAVPFPSRDTGA